MKVLVGLATALLAGSLLFVACASGDDENGSRPANSSSPGASSTGPAGSAPVDLSKDDLGRSVPVPTNPHRVVALSPTIVELMYAVGATPVGRPSSANYPEAASTLPAFGSSYQPNFEEIAAMQPDLLIADAIIHQGLIKDLESLNVPVFAIKVDSFGTVVDGLRKVGALTGRGEQADREARTLEDKMKSVKERLPSKSPRVLVVVAAGQGQFIAAKDTSYLGSLIKELGGTNVVASEPDNFRFPGFADYSLEKIVQSDPEVILGITPGGPKTTELLARTPAWSSLTAVRNGNVSEVDHVIYLESAGPRVGQILDELPRLLYPNVFATR
jgi:iron complex transport system substrate-binding protein